MAGSIESQLMTDLITSPQVQAKVGEKHSRVRVDICRITATATPGANHLFRLTKLRAHDRVISIMHIGDADAQFDDCDIGIYTPSDSTDDPVAIDHNGLMDNSNQSGADLIPTELLGLGLTNPEDFGKPLWEYCAGGPATSPTIGTEYEIVMNCVSDAAGSDHCYMIYYTAGD